MAFFQYRPYYQHHHWHVVQSAQNSIFEVKHFFLDLLNEKAKKIRCPKFTIKSNPAKSNRVEKIFMKCSRIKKEEKERRLLTASK